LLSTLTIGDTNKNKRTTSGNLIHFLNHPVVAGRPAAANSSTEPPTTLGSSSSSGLFCLSVTYCCIDLLLLQSAQIVCLF
jgi:hypothetical protein